MQINKAVIMAGVSKKKINQSVMINTCGRKEILRNQALRFGLIMQKHKQERGSGKIS